MARFSYIESEKSLNKVLKKQENDLSDLMADISDVEKRSNNVIEEAEQLLRSYDVALPKKNFTIVGNTPKDVLNVRSWETISSEAQQILLYDANLEDLFTAEELQSNEDYLTELREEFNALHRLDAVDYAIAGIAGTLAALMDILLVGIPVKTPGGIKAGPLSNYIRDLFDKALPPDKIKELEAQAKVPFDAQDNRNTTEYVNGLSAYFHRLLQLGHDPVLGFIVGVLDVLRGTMTTIDKKGKIVVQVMEVYEDRKETNIFKAIAKVFTHMKSDVNTPMGLPAPLMGLFNLFQFGKIGKEELTVAEIVQGMYYEGYDFRHFCSMSIPVMLIEVIVRISYCIKLIKEGHTLKESLPIGLNREKKPKLATMLWIAHSVSTAANAGKILFTKNPLAINYPQWVSFAKYSIKQLKWVLYDKPELRYRYVQGFIDEEWQDINGTLEKTWKSSTDNAVVINE